MKGPLHDMTVGWATTKQMIFPAEWERLLMVILRAEGNIDQSPTCSPPGIGVTGFLSFWMASKEALATLRYKKHVFPPPPPASSGTELTLWLSSVSELSHLAGGVFLLGGTPSLFLTPCVPGLESLVGFGPF